MLTRLRNIFPLPAAAFFPQASPQLYDVATHHLTNFGQLLFRTESSRPISSARILQRLLSSGINAYAPLFTIVFRSLLAIIGRRRRDRHSKPGKGIWQRIMGNESSTPVDEAVPPTTLYARNIDAVAKYIKERDVKRIVVMVSQSWT